MTTPVALIAAVSEDGFIGRDGDIPWRIKGDMKLFKEKSIHKPNIMGRKTFDSLPKALPHRTSIVITRQKDWHADGVIVAHDFDHALDIARGIPAEEIMVIGGEAVYRTGMEYADRIYLTRVHTVVGNGDARFPSIDDKVWQKVFSEPHKAQENETADYTIETYERLR